MWKIKIDYDIEFAFEIYDSLQKWHFSYRELVCKESWLWKFVCEKELVYRIWHDSKTYKKRKNDDWETMFAYTAEYWIIQSALIDEENIEQFLLDNIKIS